MEPKDILSMDGLDPWQRAVLQGIQVILLKESQREMIEKVLYPSDANPFHVEQKYKEILERVLMWGFYKEGDKDALNYVRECYLMGKNWVK